MTLKNKPIAHLLLAAGASTRMGQPKQLLSWRGQSLIRHAVSTIQQSGISDKIVVVLGANRELIAPELNDLSVEIVFNPDWSEGMGSTIRSGLEYLVKNGADVWAGVGISLVDQPLVHADHLRDLYQLWRQSSAPIAAARYEGVFGVPAIFAHSFFPHLLSLEGAAGARKLLQKFRDQVEPMDLPEGRLDLDTPEEYRKLKERD
ncbi:nucleotidyltransferase family protein [Flavilitoribacter nigricans]|uniref:MobA-like NTP transferase domain-containing protein n=1 Tax=Flavilitoribacter nigricans (strain ATCC 23147 / DSM 23189 / NBRC 102662 / NCIMB 1420 / SS-2) TaxID=1122177 RepID=A0A2D0N936_FLAN2|nr:nucleotidyltransferase family protein [Flavilitoribacter nigricans]PHN05032.1 hypothetical protein CRP01_18575 [Flavilitoribacter nigricans DSM 23189 = NBRC 102662]